MGMDKHNSAVSMMRDGVPFSVLSPLTVRYQKVLKVRDFCDEFMANNELVVREFNIGDFREELASTMTKSTIQGLPGKLLRLAFERHTNGQVVIKKTRSKAPIEVKGLIATLTKLAYYEQILPLLEDEDLRDLATRTIAKYRKSFESKKLYQNPLVAPNNLKAKFTIKSIIHGSKHLSIADFTNRSFGEELQLIAKGFFGNYKAKVQDQAFLFKKLAPLGKDIMAEYETLKMKLDAIIVIDMSDEDEILKRVLSAHQEPDRSIRNVISEIRHSYSNYDKLHLDPVITSSPFWMITGHRAIRSVVHSKIAAQAKTESVYKTAEQIVVETERAMLFGAKIACMNSDPEKFIRDSYITRVTSHIKNPVKRDEALSHLAA